MALEKELNLQPDSRRPSPREVALAGQLERLQADYLRLEAELQVELSSANIPQIIIFSPYSFVSLTFVGVNGG